jgi:gas vesicle protein
MLRGLRTATKYFTVGLLAGLLFAPRKGEETRKLLMNRGKEYAQETLNMGGDEAKLESEAKVRVADGS